jgi:hypothetical protein
MQEKRRGKKKKKLISSGDGICCFVINVSLLSL